MTYSSAINVNENSKDFQLELERLQEVGIVIHDEDLKGFSHFQ